MRRPILSSLFGLFIILVMPASALADSLGQLTNDSNTFVVANQTQNGSYANSVNAACNEELLYSVRLHNSEFGGLTNVQVSANLMSGKMTAVPAQGASQGTSGSVTVNLPANGSLAYQSGTTVLYNANGGVISALPDGITTVGVNAGNVNGSTTEFVNFKAKVACPPVVQTASLSCTELGVVQIDRTHYDFTAKATAQNANIQNYVFTVKNSGGSTVDTNTVNTSATSAVYHFNQETGKYTISTIVNTDHGTANNSNCTKQIEVAAAPAATAQTKGATTLPNTGAGDVFGIFTVASAAGGAAHYAVRRYRRN
jgi:hypothetical protein